MQKETAWAIGIGIIFGLILAFGLWRINSSINTEKPKNQNATQNTSTPSPSPSQTKKITVTSPENFSVLVSDNLQISGQASASKVIIVSINSRDYITKVDTSGNFNLEATLDPGVNSIVITDTQSENEPIKLTVAYSSLLNTSATEESNIKYQLQLGSITDITDSSIQLKTDKNEIKQISITQDVPVADTREKPVKNPKISDVAIGDQIASIGFFDSRKIFTTKRILLVSGNQDEKIITQTGNNLKGLKTDKTTQYYKFQENIATKIKATDIKKDSNLIYTLVSEIVRTVFVLE